MPVVVVVVDNLESRPIIFESIGVSWYRTPGLDRKGWKAKMTSGGFELEMWRTGTRHAFQQEYTYVHVFHMCIL